MINFQKKEVIGRCLYFISYIPILLVSILNTTMYYQYIPSAYTKLVIMFSIGILLIKFIFIDEHTFLEYMSIILALIINLLAYYKSDNKYLLIMVIFMVASSALKEKSLILSYLVITIGVLIFAFISTKMGIIPDLVYQRNMLDRHSFGIIYPTDFAAHIFYLMCALTLLRFKRYNLLDFLLLIMVAICLFRYTDARLNTVMILLLALATLILKKMPVLNKSIFKFAWIVPIFSIIFAYLSTYFYSNGSAFFAVLNKLFSGRLGIVQNVLSENGIKLFGQKIIENGWGGKGFYLNTNIYKYTYIDSAFMRLLIIYGVLATILFLFTIVVYLKTVKNAELILIVSLILISGIIEQHFIDIAYNPFLLLLASSYFKQKKENRKCKNI